jgi:hypothetical protein
VQNNMVRAGVFIGLLILLNVLAYVFHWNIRFW